MNSKKFQVFLLGQKVGKCTWSAYTCPPIWRRWSFEFNSSPIVKISQNLVLSMKRSSLPLNIYFKKIWQISGFDNMWSQRSKVALGRLEQWKIYPNSKFSNIISQCYLDPGGLWRTFVPRWTSFVNKKWGKWNGQGKKNYQPVRTWLCLGPSPKSSKINSPMRSKQLKYIYHPESFLIPWKSWYLLIWHKRNDIPPPGW